MPSPPNRAAPGRDPLEAADGAEESRAARKKSKREKKERRRVEEEFGEPQQVVRITHTRAWRGWPGPGCTPGQGDGSRVRVR